MEGRRSVGSGAALIPKIYDRIWTGPPHKVDRVLSEGDEVAGFRVLHFPGHAPGLIGLWREGDRVALVSDVVYLVDSARLKALPEGEASVPHPAFNWNHQEAKRSLRRLAELEPLVVGTGHDRPLRGAGLRATLEAAAEKY
jgi:hydroxyacylglutathione hydrolase